MEEIKINLQRELNDMSDAPILESNQILYNCSECASVIEIISIDQDNIEFQCLNNHNKKITIKEYLDKMKEYNNIILNNYVCDIHKEEYVSYCFECNMHLCKECLKTGDHYYHFKIDIIEIIPNNDVLTKIRNLIKNNKIKIKNLKIIQKETENKISHIKNDNINKIKDIKIKKKEKSEEYKNL